MHYDLCIGSVEFSNFSNEFVCCGRHASIRGTLMHRFAFPILVTALKQPFTYFSVFRRVRPITIAMAFFSPLFHPKIWPSCSKSYSYENQLSTSRLLTNWHESSAFLEQVSYRFGPQLNSSSSILVQLRYSKVVCTSVNANMIGHIRLFPYWSTTNIYILRRCLFASFSAS